MKEDLQRQLQYLGMRLLTEHRDLNDFHGESKSN
ncbi:hypothetical protein ViNHUV68_35520 [Vibrio sp. NH-UV-68]